jgi:hypothetical protein
MLSCDIERSLPEWSFVVVVPVVELAFSNSPLFHFSSIRLEQRDFRPSNVEDGKLLGLLHNLPLHLV